MIVAFDPYVGTLGKFKRQEIIKMVAEAGYEGLNLPLRPEFVNAENEGEIKETKEMLDEYGLQVPSISFGKPIATTPGKEKETIEWMQVNLKAAKIFNVPIIGIWPNLPQGVTLEQALDTLKKNALAVVPMAEKEGRVVALEFEKKHTIDNYRQGIEFIEATDKRIKLTCDTYHLNNDKAEPYSSALAMKGFISDVHLSGSHRGEPGSAGDTINYEVFMRGLKESGYSGPLVLQYKLEDVESMKRAAQFAKKLRGG